MYIIIVTWRVIVPTSKMWEARNSYYYILLVDLRILINFYFKKLFFREGFQPKEADSGSSYVLNLRSKFSMGGDMVMEEAADRARQDLVI